ncbi:MAG: carbohydrate ABC transporter permease [Clostridiales bacterium]|nr:carbohydrate ABC transporter permease [Clostridiales bacterium]
MDNKPKTIVHRKKRLKQVLFVLLVLAGGIIMVYPLLWMIMSSFKENNEIFSDAASLVPKEFRFENYINGWKGFAKISFATFFKNSFFISIVGTIGTVLSSAFVAFGFARLKFKGRNFWFTSMLITMMLPFQVIMIPQYIIFNKLGWVGTFLPLIVPSFFGGAFFIFLIIQFIYGLPKELDEAAKIDGCNYYNIFFRIILPLICPSLVTCVIFSFMWKWDDFMGSLLYLNKPSTYTVTLALKMFADPTSITDWGAMFAMATLSIIPIFVIFIFFQKYLVEGISTEGLKG